MNATAEAMAIPAAINAIPSAATNLKRDNPTLGASASSPASGHRRQSTAGKMPALPGKSLRKRGQNRIGEFLCFLIAPDRAPLS